MSYTGLLVEDEREEYNLFQGRDGLEWCSLDRIGVFRNRAVVTPTSRSLALWRQVRGGGTMESVKVDVVERLYSRDPVAKSFPDPEFRCPLSNSWQMICLVANTFLQVWKTLNVPRTI